MDHGRDGVCAEGLLLSLSILGVIALVGRYWK
jgi:hypothetical protein